MLVVVYGYRDSRFKKIRVWLLGTPLLVGAVLAFASIPYIWPVGYACSLSPPHPSRVDAPDSWAPFLGIYLIPAWTVIIVTTACLFRVYLYVRKLNRKSDKWRLTGGGTRLRALFVRGSSGTNEENTTTCRTSRRRKNTKKVARLEDRVFWQSFMYLAALYLSWTTFLVMVSKKHHLLLFQKKMSHSNGCSPWEEFNVVDSCGATLLPVDFCCVFAAVARLQQLFDVLSPKISIQMGRILVSTQTKARKEGPRFIGCWEREEKSMVVLGST